MSFADKLQFEEVTKRSVLSAADRVYDPLGLVSPAVLCPRLLLQEAWARKLSWDEEVSDEKNLDLLTGPIIRKNSLESKFRDVFLAKSMNAIKVRCIRLSTRAK